MSSLVIRVALDKADLSPSDLCALGIANQRETTVLWDRRTGAPVHNAINWQDTRTDRLCRELAREFGQEMFRDKTGLPGRAPTSRARRSAGCSTRSRACASAPRPARCCSARSTRG